VENDRNSEALASAFDEIKKADTNTPNGGVKRTGFVAVSELMPGSYAGILKSARGYDNPKYGPQISVCIELKALIDQEKKDIACWCDYGTVSVLFPKSKPEKIEHLIAVLHDLGARKENGQPLETGGDILRCKIPEKFVNVRFLHSDFTGKTSFYNIYLPFYEYNKELSNAPTLSRKPASEGKAEEGSSFLSDVPAFG
jgi:hypothetical protein